MGSEGDEEGRGGEGRGLFFFWKGINVFKIELFFLFGI